MMCVVYILIIGIVYSSEAAFQLTGGSAEFPLETGCETELVERRRLNCVGVLNHILTVPCGDYNESNKSISYEIRRGNILPSEIFTTSAPLKLMLSLSEHMSVIVCLVERQSVVEYLINVTYPPKEDNLDFIPDPVVGRPITVTCPVTGNPPPIISWTRYSDIDQNATLTLPNELEFLDERQTMWIIDKWEEEFNGFYKCCGTNVLGKTCYHDTGTFRLFDDACDLAIDEEGHIKTLDNRNLYELGSTLTVTCRYTNAYMDQPPLWYHRSFIQTNDSRIPFTGSSHYNISYKYNDKSCSWITNLTISNLTLQETGIFTCSHRTNIVEMSIDLKACYKNREDNYTLKLSSNEQTQFGSHLILTCKAGNVDMNHSPVWCIEENNNCNPIISNITSSVFSESNCSWFSQIDILQLSERDEGVYRCYIPGTDYIEEIAVSIQEIKSFKSDSTGAVASIVIGIIAVILIIISSFAMFIYWFKVTRYSRTKEPPSEGFKWDVFVSYHHEAEEFVVKHIKTPLESKYSVCWHHDDFIAGRTILDNITDAVDNSRKTIFVFSKSFSESDHCMSELGHSLYRLQNTRTRCIIPITLDTNAVPKELKSQVTYWPIIEVDDNFYYNLTKAIGPPCNGNMMIIQS